MSKTAGMIVFSESNGGGVNYKFTVFHVFFLIKQDFSPIRAMGDIIVFCIKSVNTYSGLAVKNVWRFLL
jgi:nitrogen fixation protein FixH